MRLHLLAAAAPVRGDRAWHVQPSFRSGPSVRDTTPWADRERLHGYLGDLPLAEFEGSSLATQQGDSALVDTQMTRPSVGPCAVQIVTAAWVHWWNTERLYTSI